MRGFCSCLTLRSLELDIDMKKDKGYTYTWGGSPCVRFGENFGSEAHPCYYCGTPLFIDGSHSKYCNTCHFMECHSCGKCWCNAPTATRAALRLLRNKYCCTREYFEAGVKTEDPREKVALLLVPHFQDALDYCRRIKGCLEED